ncbi:MAG TPA: hypothetical protein VF785_21815, partial [Gemmatimonadaceae bacterium]
MASRRNTSKKSVAKKKKPAAKKAPKKNKKPLASRKRPAAAKAAAKRAAQPPRKASSKKPAFNAKTDSANDPNWRPPVWDDDVLLGAHVSIAGGTHQAPPRARAIGASAMQIFTKMANRWAERGCEPDERSAFRSALDATRVRHTIAHDSYLINLASPDDTLRRRSIESFVAEL